MDIIGVGLGVVFEEFDEAMCKEYGVKRLKTHCKLIITINICIYVWKYLVIIWITCVQKKIDQKPRYMEGHCHSIIDNILGN